jgi:hypothetical protein
VFERSGVGRQGVPTREIVKRENLKPFGGQRRRQSRQALFSVSVTWNLRGQGAWESSHAGVLKSKNAKGGLVESSRLVLVCAGGVFVEGPVDRIHGATVRA